jgi:VanZ family protein
MIPPSPNPLYRPRGGGAPLLRLRTLWLALTWLQVALVWVLSLAPATPELVGTGHGDKLGHVLAYFSLAAWFTALAPGRAPRIWLGLALMGIALEALQGVVSGVRTPSAADVVANLLGVAAGAAFSRRLWRGWLPWLDRVVWTLGRSGS